VSLVQGVLLLLGGHVLAVTVAYLASRSIPINAHVPVLTLLGIVQLVYVVPLLLFTWRKRRPVAHGVLAGAAATVLMTAVALNT